MEGATMRLVTKLCTFAPSNRCDVSCGFRLFDPLATPAAMPWLSCATYHAGAIGQGVAGSHGRTLAEPGRAVLLQRQARSGRGSSKSASIEGREAWRTAWVGESSDRKWLHKARIDTSGTISPGSRNSGSLQVTGPQIPASPRKHLAPSSAWCGACPLVDLRRSSGSSFRPRFSQLSIASVQARPHG